MLRVLSELKFAVLEKDDLVKKLASLNSNVKIVRFVERHGYFKEEFQRAASLQRKAKKNAKQSNFFRKQGNERHMEKKFIDALKLLNESICLATSGSEQLGKAYANRSAVYFSMGMFALSMKSIKLARDNGYPEHLASKLNDRELKCTDELERMRSKIQQEFSGVKPELSYSPHEAPFIANCLELKVNEHYGRHIVANADLKVGNIIAIERSFCSVITIENRYMCCANCLQENDYDLIPCPNCHSAMFCSPECYDQAINAFHDIECPIMDVLLEPSLLHPKEYVAARLIIMATKCFKTSDELIEFVKDLKGKEKNVFNTNYKDNRNIELLASILNLQGYEEKEPAINKNSLGIATALINQHLLKFTVFENVFKTKKQTEFLIDLLYRLNKITNLNCVSFNAKRLCLETDKRRLEGHCVDIYPFASLINHSCTPNIKQVKYGQENVLIVIKPIMNGEQLFISYSE